MATPEEERRRLLEEILGKEKDTLEVLEEQHAVYEQIAKTVNVGAALESARLAKEEMESQLAVQEQIKAVREAVNETALGDVVRLEELNKLSDEALLLEAERLKGKTRLGLEIGNQINLLNEQLELQKEITAENKNWKTSLKASNKIVQQMAGSKLGKKLFPKDLSGKLTNLTKGFADIAKNPAAFKKVMKGKFSALNLVGSAALMVAEQTMKMVMAADKARAAMSAATGTGYEYQGVLIDAQKAGNLYGLSMDEAGKAVTALIGSTTNFVNSSEEAKRSLTTTVGLLGKLGVSAEVASDMIQTMNLTLGMTMEQAAEATKSIAMMGTQLGINAKQMTKDFQASMKTLAVYGPKATTVFKNLAANAKAAGVEMGSLLTLAGKFDTFKDAATTVAKMNALLGTQLSTTQMLMQTEDERIETLISSVQAQGVAFKDMDRFQQKAVAAAAGITDLNEANKIFGMNLGQFKEYRGEMDANADAQQKFKDSLDAAIPLATKFMSLFQELGVLIEPILDGILWVIDGIRHGLEEIPAPVKEVMGVLTVVVASAMALWQWWGAVAGVAGSLSAAFTGVAAALGPVGWAVLAVVAAIAALWAIMSMSDEPVAKFNTNMSAIGPDTAAKTRRAGAGMTQNTVNYARSTNTTVNSGGGAPKTIVAQFGEKEFKGVVEDYSRPVAENVATS